MGIVIIILVLVYIISPVDLAPGLLIDDAVVAILGAAAEVLRWRSRHK